MTPFYVAAEAISHAVHLAEISITSKNNIHFNDDLQDVTQNCNSVPQRSPRLENSWKSRTILVDDAECLSDDSILTAAKTAALKQLYTTS